VCPSARRPRASATRVSSEENRARYPRDALVAERRCTHRRMVPLPPMRTEPASFLSFSTSMVTSYESAWVKRRAVSRGARALNGHASVSVRRARHRVRNPLADAKRVFRVRVLVREDTHL
jgi:hypothetical protein